MSKNDEVRVERSITNTRGQTFVKNEGQTLTKGITLIEPERDIQAGQTPQSPITVSQNPVSSPAPPPKK